MISATWEWKRFETGVHSNSRVRIDWIQALYTLLRDWDRESVPGCSQGASSFSGLGKSRNFAGHMTVSVRQLICVRC